MVLMGHLGTVDKSTDTSTEATGADMMILPLGALMPAALGHLEAIRASNADMLLMCLWSFVPCFMEFDYAGPPDAEMHLMCLGCFAVRLL
jgi:hypothetical protein